MGHPGQESIEHLTLPDDGVLIIGAGIAGLYTAIKLAPRPVYIITAARLGRGSASTWAQGGLAVAMGADDSPALHFEDTIKAGAGLVDEPPAHILTEEGPQRVRDLIDLGVPFDRDPQGQLIFGREAAHNRRRIIHVTGDQAGAAIMETLSRHVLAADHITLLERHVGEDIWLDDGAARACLTYDIDAKKRKLIRARNIILATGGIGGLYAITTNPPHAQGHGIAMAYRAGATIMDPEFVQFHPTAMDIGGDPAPLATEALRGDGAILIDKNGRRLMEGVHEDLDLAPRDIVARTVASAIKQGRGAFLDTRKAIGDKIAHHFPTVYEALRKAHIDPTRQPIPIAPAAHYHMGGVRTDVDGRSDCPGLWAVGEVAATAIHGANRLASNSLLEALVFGARAAKALLGENTKPISTGPMSAGPLSHKLPADTFPAPANAECLWPLRQAMSAQCGLLRDGKGLRALQDRLRRLSTENAPNATGFENAAQAAFLIAHGAYLREESRGAHQREDFPDTSTPQHILLKFDPDKGLVAKTETVTSSLTPKQKVTP